jgi:predicted ATP-binding protein involved in virulence
MKCATTSKKTRALSITRQFDGISHVKELKSWFKKFFKILIVNSRNSPNFMETQKFITVIRKAPSGLYHVSD